MAALDPDIFDTDPAVPDLPPGMPVLWGAPAIEPIEVAPVSGLSPMAFNATNYTAMVMDELLVVCAGDSKHGSGPGFRAIWLDPDALFLGPFEEWVAEVPGDQVTMPTVVTTGWGVFRHQPLRSVFGPIRAYVAYLVTDGVRTRVALVGLKRRWGPVRGTWTALGLEGIVSGSHDKCDTPSLTHDRRTGKLYVAFVVEPDAPRVYVVELDSEGVPVKDPVFIAHGKNPSIAAFDGWVVVAWKQPLKDAKTPAVTEVFGLCWEADDPTIPVDEALLLAGPESDLDDTETAKDPCVVAVGPGGRFFVTYDKRRGTIRTERDIGVVELDAGEWRYDGVGLRALDGGGAVQDQANFPFGQGGAIDGTRLLVWEAQSVVDAQTTLGYALAEVGTKSVWRDEQYVFADPKGRDTLFPTYCNDSERFFIVAVAGTITTGSSTILDGVLTVREARPDYWIT